MHKKVSEAHLLCELIFIVFGLGLLCFGFKTLSLGLGLEQMSLESKEHTHINVVL